MSIAGSIFGDKPAVAPYISTIFSDEQIKSLEENLKAFPKIKELGNQFYDYMMGSMNKAIPAFGGLLAKGGDLASQMQGIAGEELAGRVPKDVQDFIRRSSAYQNLGSSGVSGSAMQGANFARNLGLTSLDMQTKGAAMAGEAGNAAQRWAGLASGLIMSPSGMMVTPQQQAALTMQNNLYKQATQQLRNNVAAAPDPGLQAANQWLEQVGGTVVSSYLGGGMGGGKGGGNYKTSYNANDYLGGAGQSDVSNPGQYVQGGGGGGAVSPSGGGGSLSASTLFPDIGFQDIGYQTPNNPSAYSTQMPNLWNSYVPQSNYGGDLSSFFSPTYGVSDFTNTAGNTNLWGGILGG